MKNFQLLSEKTNCAFIDLCSPVISLSKEQVSENIASSHHKFAISKLVALKLLLHILSLQEHHQGEYVTAHSWTLDYVF